jgi:hypothetical protein
VLKAIVVHQAVAIATLLLVELRLEIRLSEIWRASGSAASIAAEVEDHFDSDGSVKCQ